MTFLIREPRHDEAETLADLHVSSWAETYAGLFPESEWDKKARAARVRMWTAICTAPRPGDRFAVAERDGALIGLAGLGSSQDDPAVTKKQLWFLYVLKSEHGTGAGQALVDAVLTPNEPVSLWVLEANARARAFYERNGFVPDGSRQGTGFVQSGDEIRMIRP